MWAANREITYSLDGSSRSVKWEGHIVCGQLIWFEIVGGLVELFGYSNVSHQQNNQINLESQWNNNNINNIKMSLHLCRSGYIFEFLPKTFNCRLTLIFSVLSWPNFWAILTLVLRHVAFYFVGTFKILHFLSEGVTHCLALPVELLQVGKGRKRRCWEIVLDTLVLANLFHFLIIYLCMHAFSNYLVSTYQYRYIRHFGIYKQKSKFCPQDVYIQGEQSQLKKCVYHNWSRHLEDQ